MPRQYTHWSDEEDAILRELWDGRTHSEVAALMGRTPRSIDSRGKRIGLPSKEKPPLIDSSLTLNSLSNVEYQVMMGSFIGDGHVTRHREGLYNFGFNHGVKQEEYLRWKGGLLSRLHPRVSGSGRLKSLITATHPMFTDLRDGFYGIKLNGKPGKVGLDLDLLSRLDGLGLMVWYLDDGDAHVTANGRVAHVRIRSFLYPREDMAGLCEIIKENSGVELLLKSRPVSGKGHGEEHTISLSVEQRATVLPVWREMASDLHLPESMMYKLPPP